MKKLILFSYCLIFSCIYADMSKQTIYQYLPENPVIVEAGVYDAEDTYQMATQIQGCTIYGFEPIPKIYKRAKKRTQNLPNVQLFPYALSNANGFADFYVSSGASLASSSLLQPKEHLNYYPSVAFKKKIKVKTITLDEWAARNGVTKIDFLWLDMQGAEYNMLNASPEMLKTVQVIFTEVSLKELYIGCPLYPVFKEWLEMQGFELVGESLAYESYGDALFVRKNN